MTFLQLAKTKSPRMYLFFIIFLIFTFITNALRISTTPFYVYGMYSAPVPVTDEFSFMVTVENGRKIYNKPEIWNHHKRIAIYYSSRTRDQLLQKNNFDSISHGLSRVFPDKRSVKNNYPAWLLRYINDLEGGNVNGISMYRFTVKYDEKGNLKLKNVEKLFTESARKR